MKSGILLLLTFPLALFTSAPAATYTLEPAADARILSCYPPSNFGADILAVYTESSVNNIQRTLIRFDLSAITLATNEQVQQAILTLKADVTYGANSSNRLMEVYRVVSPWTEAGVSWLNRDATNAWANQGGDFVGTGGQPYAVSSSTAMAQQAVAWDISALLAEWMTNATANYGLLLRSSNGNHLCFYQRESVAALRPTLTVVTGLSPLHVAAKGREVLLWWTGAGVLQEKTNLSPGTVWDDSARILSSSNGTNSVVIPAPTGARFFRARN